MSTLRISPYQEIGARTFQSPEVVDAYDARLAYPAEAIDYMLEHTLTPFYTTRRTPRILDAGTGNGLLTEAIIKSGIQAEIAAMDISKPMVEAFCRRVRLPRSVILGSFNDMPFLDSSFDLITFGSALHWGDPNRLPAELHRILRPGACVASISCTQPDNTEFTDIIHSLPGQAALDNPMTSDWRKIELGAGFTFENFRSFPCDRRITPAVFGELLKSIDPIQNAPATLKHKAETAMWDYARRHATDGLITVPYDTLVRIARVSK